MLSEAQEFGISCEDRVIKALRAYFRIKVPSYRLSAGADLFCNSLPVFVKAARRSFCRNGRRSYYSRFLFRFTHILGLIGLVAVVCVTEASEYYLFLIPLEVCKEHKFLQICCHPADYSGWARDYLIGVI